MNAGQIGKLFAPQGSVTSSVQSNLRATCSQATSQLGKSFQASLPPSTQSNFISQYPQASNSTLPFQLNLSALQQESHTTQSSHHATTHLLKNPAAKQPLVDPRQWRGNQTAIDLLLKHSKQGK